MGFTETCRLATSSSHGPQFLIVLFQGLHIRRHGVIGLRGGSGCGGTWDIFEGGYIVFSERGGRLISCALCRLFRRSGDHYVLFHKVFYCCGPASVSTLFPFFHHQVFEDIDLIDARNELHHFIVVGDLDAVLCGVFLTPCEVSHVGAEMLIGRVAPGGNERFLLRHLFCVCDDRPSFKVRDKC